MPCGRRRAVARTDDTFEERDAAWRMRTVVVPLAVLVAFVALVGGLVLSGVLQGHELRAGPEHAPTTPATVEIAP